MLPDAGDEREVYYQHRNLDKDRMMYCENRMKLGMLMFLALGMLLFFLAGMMMMKLFRP